MSQKLAKTPDELYKQIKPARYGLRVDKVDWSNPTPYSKKTGRPYFHQIGDKFNRYELYNGTPKQAQELANENNEAYGTHDPNLKNFRGDSHLPRSRVGKYGQVRLPEQWKYKRADQLADKMVSGFEGDPTANMTSDEYREWLMNEKGWDKDAANRQVDLFYPNQQPKVKNWNPQKYKDMIDVISDYRANNIPMEDIQTALTEEYGPDHEDLIQYAISKWAE